jgi:Spy/CpxP family protein refolding chaperone
MKLKTLLSIFIVLFSICSFSQNPKIKEKQEKEEKIRSLKIALITNELKLTPTEAEKFWPIYNAFEDKQIEIRHKKRRSSIIFMDESVFSTLSDKQAELLLDQLENNEEQLYLNQKKLNTNLRTVLSAKKILLLKKAEDHFNKKLLQQYRTLKTK